MTPIGPLPSDSAPLNVIRQLEAEMKSTEGEGRDWLPRVFLYKKIQKTEGETQARAAAREVEGPSLRVASHTLLVIWITSQHQVLDQVLDMSKTWY